MAEKSAGERPGPGGAGASLTTDQRRILITLVHQTFGHSRFTQDSPVRPDVWLAYWDKLAQGDLEPRVDLIITPREGDLPGHLTMALEDNLVPLGRGGRFDDAAAAITRRQTLLAYSQSIVNAKLTFQQLLRAIMPLTSWWSRLERSEFESKAQVGTEAEFRLGAQVLANIAAFRKMVDQKDPTRWSQITIDTAIKEERAPFQLYRFAALAALTEHWQKRLRDVGRQTGPSKRQLARTASAPKLVAGITAEIVALAHDLSLSSARLGALLDRLLPALREAFALIDTGTSVLLAPPIRIDSQTRELLRQQESRSPARIHAVSINRDAEGAATQSRKTVKVDAAHRLFQVDTSGIVWAVVDSGIDARHAAFRSNDVASPATAAGAKPLAPTRVVKTYDFSYIRELLATASFPEICPDLSAEDRKVFDAILLGRRLDELTPDERSLYDSRCRELQDDEQNRILRWQTYVDWIKNERKEVLRRLGVRRASGVPVDWSLIEPLIEVPHNEDFYRPPLHEHGTHVAGILAGSWKEEPPSRQARELGPDGFQGMCPDLDIFDIRAFDGEGKSSEDKMINALEFVEYLNQGNALNVHGVNLSLAIGHDVQAFACGQTLVCQACNRLVRSGVVVVAAAGNMGYEGNAAQQSLGQNARDISITDPGNAELVITVGATHRDKPHTYGVSYFSSRGPTADGRMKPDLVAPGEKIIGPIPGDENAFKPLDGTSMAAPHVSGVAAMLLARNRELIGQPQQVKEILCRSATNLGRLPAFQGAGLLDALRALQSV